MNKTLKNAYVISLKFSQGLKKEFIVLGENIQKHGINVRYIISDRYSHLDRSCYEIEYIPTSDGIKGIIWDTFNFINTKKIMNIFPANLPFFVCFYNSHPLNPIIAKKLRKKFPNAILSLYLHDPYKPDKKPYGIIKAYYIFLVEFIQGLTVKYMDYIISPSEYSSKLFEMKYKNFNGENFVAPLLVPDSNISKNKKRNFFSIVGGVHQATGHDLFIELINYTVLKKLDYEFIIITSSNISKFINNLLPDGKKKLKIINDEIISDSEINDVINESYAVFRLDREVTQSGVIPVCYMNKTPVIVRDIPGLKQHVEHKNNGYIIPYNCTLEDIIQAMEFVKENFVELSGEARKSYERIWAEWQWNKYYEWLIKLI